MNSIEKKKYIVEITHLNELPGGKDNWTKSSNWPGNGLYVVADESAIYHVYQWGISYISDGKEFLLKEFVDQGSPITESLLLKAIAAAAHAKELK
jgi:hypothetical protein